MITKLLCPLSHFCQSLYSKNYGVSMERRQQKRQLLRIALFIGGGTKALPLDKAREPVLEVDLERLLESECPGVVAVAAP